MTFSEFDRLIRGWQRRQERQQSQQIDAWQRTRLLATILVNINRKPDTPAQTPEEVLWLPGDAPRPNTAPETPEDTEELWRLLDELDADIIKPHG